MKLKKKQSGQSVLEYAILFFVLASVIVVMSVYLSRTVKGRFKQIESEVNQPVSVRWF